jgi:RNA polymerase sigma factor (sigma-70 family)
MRRAQPYEQKPGYTDEKAVVQEMLYNPDSIHWIVCEEFVVERVNYKLFGVRKEDREDIANTILIKTVQYLHAFRFQCTFGHWVNTIIETCIADFFRKSRNKETVLGSSKENDDEGDTRFPSPGSAEEDTEHRETIKRAVSALFEYAETHSDAQRNREIVELFIMGLFLQGGLTYNDIADRVGCDPSVVGYVLREAKKYAKQKSMNE